MFKSYCAAILALTTTSPAQAQSYAAVRSAVFVERDNPGTGGGHSVERATVLSRGERVVTILNWQAPNLGKPFTVTTRMPSTLSFDRSSSGAEEVSVDGGKSWGRLGELRVRDAEGQRTAGPEDITHLRWRMNGRQQRGSVTYRAWVR